MSAIVRWRDLAFVPSILFGICAFAAFGIERAGVCLELKRSCEEHLYSHIATDELLRPMLNGTEFEEMAKAKGLTLHRIPAGALQALGLERKGAAYLLDASTMPLGHRG